MKFLVIILGIAISAYAGSASAQCVGGLIVNCPPAVSPQASDLVLGYQNLQNPHTRSFTIHQLSTLALTLPILTVATLPTCNSANSGAMAAVSDAVSPTYNGSLTGNGATVVPVFCNGASWTSH